MNILLATHSVVKGDGQGRVNYELAAYLARQNHRVILLADQVAPELLDLGCTWQPLHPPAQRPILFKILAWAEQATAYLKQHHHRYELIHLNGATAYVPHHVNTCHFVHHSFRDYMAKEKATGLRGLYYKFYTDLNCNLEKKVYAQAQKVVAVSPRTARELQTHLGFSDKKATVICNGVDIDLFSPDIAKKIELRKQLNIDPETLALFYAGEYVQQRKGLGTVLQALHNLPPNIQLYVAGRGITEPYQEFLQGLENRVHFLGFRRDIPDLFRAMDIFVYPSRYDTFSLVVLEALASGLGVITTKESGFGELIHSGHEGYILSTPYAHLELHQLLLKLSQDRPHLERLSQAGRELAEQYTWHKMAQAYEQLYTQLLSTP